MSTAGTVLLLEHWSGAKREAMNAKKTKKMTDDTHVHRSLYIWKHNTKEKELQGEQR